MFAELCLCVREQPSPRICHIDRIAPSAVFLYLVNDHKVVLIPMGNTGERRFVCQLSEGEQPTHTLEAKGFGSFANPEERDAAFTQSTNLPQLLAIGLQPIVPGYHR